MSSSCVPLLSFAAPIVPNRCRKSRVISKQPAKLPGQTTRQHLVISVSFVWPPSAAAVVITPAAAAAAAAFNSKAFRTFGQIDAFPALDAAMPSNLIHSHCFYSSFLNSVVYRLFAAPFYM